MSPRKGCAETSPGGGPRHWLLTARWVLVGLFVVMGLVGSACTSDGAPQTGAGTGPTAPTVPSSSTPASTLLPIVGAPTTSGTVDTLPPTTVPLEDLILTLTEVGAGFDAPVLLTADPEGGADLVVEQSGRIVRNDDGHTVVLDITEDVRFDGEQGLLGVAFHPLFDDMSLAYVNYVDRSQTTVIEEFEVAEGVFDISSRRTILTVNQPARNHNGGMIAFGPDGYLWIGMGDGGGANDRFNQAQDADTLLGAMLRIDVDTRGNGAYGIPADNPFADGVGGAPEVWATGLRNPWRFSFDGDDVWIADVGQNRIEEVNRMSAADAGPNFGWPIMEGSACFEVEECDPTPFTLPVAEYSHDDGCSITGGNVYRGEAVPGLHGQYFFSDFCSGFLRSTTSGVVLDWTEQTGKTPQVSGFGVGGDGELYVVSHGGSLYRIEKSA